MVVDHQVSMGDPNAIPGTGYNPLEQEFIVGPDGYYIPFVRRGFRVGKAIYKVERAAFVSGIHAGANDLDGHEQLMKKRDGRKAPDDYAN
jgi:hypothetical protein